MTDQAALSSKLQGSIPSIPVPIVALDFAREEDALALVDRLPTATFFKVGLQLYTAVGPDIVREIKGRGLQVFLDLKLHDIPNTVAGAVRSVAALDVDLLTVHASGGQAMLRAAAEAAADSGAAVRLFGVTALTSLSARELADAWGRDDVSLSAEVVRLARLAGQAGLDGVVTSVQEVANIRSAVGATFPVITPGIRSSGDDVGDQARVATPGDAALLGVDYIVIGRPVTAAPDPGLAFERIVEAMRRTERVGSQ